MIDDTERFIERFRYKPTKAIQVQSKIKQLRKLERIEIEEEDTSAINIRFSPAPRSGTVVVEADEASKRYGSHLVLDRVSMKIERGEKVAFVGRNGEGKTTLARMILDQVDFQGTLKRGHNVNIGYFAQNQDELLDDDMTVFETVDRIAVGDIRTRLRDILGAFLFHGEDIDKKVKVLSGGERSRLAIVQLLLEPYNLLLLDEPTNHLDIRSKEILKQALKKFDGTLIVVSHDRDFLDGLVEKVYEFRNRKIRTHLGGIAEFLRARKIESLRELERKSPAAGKGYAAKAKVSMAAGIRYAPAGEGGAATETGKAAQAKGSAEAGMGDAPAGEGGAATGKGRPPAGNGSPAPGKNGLSAENDNQGLTKVLSRAKPGISYQEKKENERVHRRLKKQVTEVEAQITATEHEIAEMDARLASGDPAVISDPAFYSEYEEKKNRLEALMEKWEEAHTELESFQTEYMNNYDTV